MENQKRNQNVPDDPSPWEIAMGTAEIQARWSAAEERSRRVGRGRVKWAPPYVEFRQLGTRRALPE